MIKYRPQREYIDEAMTEARTFESLDAMKMFILDHWRKIIPDPFSLDDIVIGQIVGDDKRIGWKNVRHVCVKRLGKEVYYINPQCIGWCGE